ncbi:pentapeptide repeat-containing protein [Hyphomicrobium sp.]|uniref:pentapeptide repeat-containing protein n=1 Tax=Hyphomicrobium sp. TaxID=82 RepID=UPI002C3AAE0A|nr:pentapeptide repeat-containing protein [Hyphomicrobium sp.]HVZ06065.1 pentapeptide repeat-containing protein [Hyphomicrobium sp.]
MLCRRGKRVSGMWKTALLVMVGCGTATLSQAHAADMTARQVTRLLFTSPAGSTPNLSNKDLSGLDLSGLDFKKAKLNGVNFYGTDLTGANLSGASLKAARLDRATLIGTNLSGADLSGASLLRPNVFEDMKPTTRSGLSFAGARLVGANLNGRFDGVNFSRADLSSAVFGPRDPREEVLITPMMSLAAANFGGAKLVGANLSRNSLENANFTDADLTHANLRGARLGGANFSGAILDGVDMTGAALSSANLQTARDLDSAIGLSTTP